MTEPEGTPTAVVVGGTVGIGRAIVEHLAGRGSDVVLTGRDEARAAKVAKQIGPNVSGIALDLSEPHTIADALKGIEQVDQLVISAVERDSNHVRSYDIEAAIRLVTLKLVGYTEVIHTLVDRMTPDTSIVLYGGLAKERPYDGSTTVTTVNGGVTSMVRTLAIELAPIRVNAIHPAFVGDSPYWENKNNDAAIARTPIGRLVTMEEIVDATMFLLDNAGVNATNLNVDGGWLSR